MVLLAISGLMGVTILFATSTDLQISGNYRRAVQAFYAAEAGLVEAQVRLGGGPATGPSFLSDPITPYQSNWSAYLLTHSDWKPENDQSYNFNLTNYVPVLGNPTNTVLQVNSVQVDGNYWVKVHHQTEYDAEQRGHRPAIPHYRDEDGSTILHSPDNRGRVIVFGYPLNTSLKAEPFTSSAPSVYAPVEVITSHGEVEGADSILQAEVAHPSGPPVWAPLYVGNRVVLSGSSIIVDGMDTCGLLPGNRPPISLAPSATLVGMASLTGNPPSSQVSPASLDLEQQIKDLKKGANLVSADLINVSLGTATGPALQYAEPASGVLTLTNVTGYGILLVKGALRVVPPFNWKGLIVVSGGFMLEVGPSPVSIHGAVYVDHLQALNDEVALVLDACPIASSLRILPVQVLTWRQLL